MKNKVFNKIIFYLIVLFFSLAGSAFAQSDLTVSTNTTLDAGEYTYKNVLITNNAVLTLNSNTSLAGFKGVKITADNITVEAGSSISADGTGYGSCSGPGTAAQCSGYGAGGAGYGGKGGDSLYTYDAGSTYGSAMEPTDLGSGGGDASFYYSPGSPGGGAIRLIANNTLQNDGVISANGGTPTAGGGGSGGSIYVTTNNLSGSGTFTANGSGIVAGWFSGGGGGGRIAIYYQTSTFAGSSEATGATGYNNYNGEEGTIGFFDTLNNDFYAGHFWYFQQSSSPFSFNNIVLRGSRVIADDNLSFTAKTISVNENSLFTILGKGTFNTDNLMVDSTSALSADGQGFGPGQGPGAGQSAVWGGAGGGYGGKGGNHYNDFGGGSIYGSSTKPVDLGSGGGNDNDGLGGTGGGAIRIVANDTLTLNGIISTNAGIPTSRGGGGSGGSIYVTVNSLTGSGYFKANGSDGAISNSGGGGGGRIAIYYQNSTFNGTVEARGGTGVGTDGEDGTVGFFDTLNNDFYAGHSWYFQHDDSPFNFRQIKLNNSKVGSDDGNVFTTHEISLTGGSIISANLSLTTDNLTIDAGSLISADGRGYGTDSGLGAGGGGAYGGAGGGYGGMGGNHYSDFGGGPTYGSETAPVDPGSGGGTGYYLPGGSGGGAIRLIVNNTFTNNGSVTAYGSNADRGGGGSGGSIYVTTNILAGSGLFAASGGSADPTYCGGGGGGRIAVYAQTSTFKGIAEAKGGFGKNYGQDGTVIVPEVTLDTALGQLTETHTSQSSLVETILSQDAAINNASASGALNGSLSFTSLAMVSIKTGSFAGNGFTKGQWNATLENMPYQGEWKGMFFPKPAEGKIYIKGTTSGDIPGMIDGYLSESIEGSGVYDTYTAIWNIAKVKNDLISGSINLSGTVAYQGSTEYPNTGIYALQSSIEGSVSGIYNGPLSTVMTLVRINSAGNPYDGEGFSTISYSSQSGSGEGWTYDKLNSSQQIELKGLFTSPYLGMVSGLLDETKTPRILTLTIERPDFNSPPKADLQIARVSGPASASPGETVNIVIEYRNNGLKSAENLSIVVYSSMAGEATTISIGGVYDYNHQQLTWNLPSIAPQTNGFKYYKLNIPWGLTSDTVLSIFALVVTQGGVTNSFSPASFKQQPVNKLKSSAVMQVQAASIKPANTKIQQEMFWYIIYKPCSQRAPDLDNIGRGQQLQTPPSGGSSALTGHLQGLQTQYISGQNLAYINAVIQLVQQLDQDPNYIANNFKAKTFQAVICDLAHQHNYKPDDFTTQLAHQIWNVHITTGHDPNIKYGPDENVLAGQTLNYKVEYSNIGEGIAFGVYFTDTLDTNLDESTLQIGPVLDVKTNAQIAPAGTYNPATRTITWFVGETGPGDGGYANINVNVKNNTPECTEILNHATIYFPSVPEETRTNGIVSIVGVDSDGDKMPDCKDGCPNDPNKTYSGRCGCGIADTDSDDDGTPDCNDQCLNDPDKTAPGLCGCGVPETDTDGDGVPDCKDNCPTIPNGPLLGTCTEGEQKENTCNSDADCGQNGFCSMNQEDSLGNGTGDACRPSVSTTTSALPTTTTTEEPTTSSSTSSIVPTTTTTVQPTTSSSTSSLIPTTSTTVQPTTSSSTTSIVLTTTTTVQPTTSSSTSSSIQTTTTTTQPAQSYLPLAITALSDAINLETQARDAMMSSAITALKALFESSKTKIGEALTNITKAKQNGELSKLTKTDIIIAQYSLEAARALDITTITLLKKDSNQTRKAAQKLIKAAIYLKMSAKSIITK